MPARAPRGPLDRTVAERAWLTLRYHGPKTLAFRAVTLPLRATPWSHVIGHGERFGTQRAIAERWYGHAGPPVTIVIPTYGPPDDVVAAVESIRATTDAERVRIAICDDASAPEHQERLRALHARELRGTRLILAEANGGFAANVNRGLRAAPPGDDVVLFNSDVVAHRGWLEALAHCAHTTDNVAAVGPKLLYPSGKVQSAGSQRHLYEPEWFDHRYRFAPGDHGATEHGVDCLGVTGALMYIPSAARRWVGLLDERYGMGFEDMDWCLRAWDLGMRVRYHPPAVLTHRESVSRGRVQGDREQRSQRRFWSRWGDWLDHRDVRTRDGKLRVIYVTEDTGVGGGHRDVFEHLDRLAARGHDVELWSLAGPPDWFDLQAPVRRFGGYAQLEAALSQVPAIKVATWWATSPAVWRGAMTSGYPVYFVQDIETSYYPDHAHMRAAVFASYRQEFRYMTISEWNRDAAAQARRRADAGPARDRPGELPPARRRPPPRRRRAVPGAQQPAEEPAAHGRRLERARRRPARAVDVRDRAPAGRAPRARYVEAPSDAGVNELLNEATAFVQTSTHEGFCLPVLEAMAAGTPVVCTDAHGNRDVCRDEENCLVADPTVEAVPGRCAGCSTTATCGRGSSRRAGDRAGVRVGSPDRRARGLLRAGRAGALPRRLLRAGARGTAADAAAPWTRLREPG